MFYFDKNNLRSFLKRKCRPLYCIWYGRRKDTWRKTRCLCSALTGTVCAWLIWRLIVASFEISKNYQHFVIILTAVIVVGGYVFTDAMKCVTLMIFVALMGKSGRGYLRALSFAIVLAGPIENLSSNTGEIVRVFSCSKILTINLTRTRFDLMTKPFQKTLVHMKNEIKEVQETFYELKDVTKALHEEIMGEDPPDMFNADLNETDSTTFENVSNHRIVKRHHSVPLNPEYVEDKYKNKFKKRCLQQLDSGKARCRKAFANSLNTCHEKMPIVLKTLVCWPFKVDFICNINILGDPDQICDPSDAIPKNFGETYVDLATTENKLYEESSDVKVNYTILSPDKMAGLKSAEATAKSIAKEFTLRKRIFDSILKIFQRFLGFMIINVLIVCVKYHKLYKNDLEYDNIYISEYFKHIDEKRKTLGKHYLLPLKKYEQKNLIDASQAWRRTQSETRAATFLLIQFLLEIVSGCFFMFLDYIIVAVLLIIRNNSEMSFVQEGEHTIKFYSIVDPSVIELYTPLNPYIIFPIFSIFSFYIKLFGLYILILLLIYQSTTFLRMRRLICGYFYRKREKKRILYLYNSLLKQRRTLRETMLKQAKFNYANRKIRLKANMFLNLRLRWPHYFNWLIKFRVGRRKCVICDEFEDSKFTICKNVNCGVSYCSDCWQDMGNICLVCNEVVSLEVILNFNDFFEEFSFV